jgi:hypothetical protein
MGDDGTFGFGLGGRFDPGESLRKRSRGRPASKWRRDRQVVAIKIMAMFPHATDRLIAKILLEKFPDMRSASPRTVHNWLSKIKRGGPGRNS